MAIGFGIALMGGFYWANNLPENFRGQETPIIAGAMIILSALGFFVGYLIDRKINTIEHIYNSLSKIFNMIITKGE